MGCSFYKGSALLECKFWYVLVWQRAGICTIYRTDPTLGVRKTVTRTQFDVSGVQVNLNNGQETLYSMRWCYRRLYMLELLGNDVGK